MNRLQFVISDVIDQALKAHYFDNVKFSGLCEHEIKDGKTIPVKYKGYGDFEFVGFDDSNGLNIYHRLVSMVQDDDNDSGFGNKPLKIEAYNLTMVAFGNQRTIVDSNNNINYKIADEFRSLFPRKLTTVQLFNIDGHIGLISVTGTNQDKKDVFATELPDNDIKVKPETLLFAINYTLTLKFIGDCKDLSCPVSVPFLDLNNISCANINDPNFGLSQNKFDECGLITLCAAATVTNSDSTFNATVASGATLILSDINHIDSDGTPVPTPAQTVFISTVIKNILIFDFQASAGDDYTATIEADTSGTYDLDTAVLTNVATVVYKKNTIIVTGSQTFVATDTLEVIITRTNDALDSKVKLTET